MISIVVPVFNAEQYISRCINSILAQEYLDWELILVDDGSLDRSGEICDGYGQQDVRIHVIHQKNAGVSAARNRGIEVSQGEHICFIDADDYVSSNYLKDFDLEQDLDFVLQGMTFVYNGVRHSETYRPNLTSCMSVEEMLDNKSTHVLIQGPYCKLFKRSLVIDNSLVFPEGINYSEDGVFLLNYLSLCKKSVKINSVVNYYYTHESTVTLTNKFHKGDELFCAVKAQYDALMKLMHSHHLDGNCFLNAYRNHLAIDFYQSIYNSWIDKEIPFLRKICFFYIPNREFLKFIVSDTNLPRGFRFLRMLVRGLRFL